MAVEKKIKIVADTTEAVANVEKLNTEINFFSVMRVNLSNAKSLCLFIGIAYLGINNSSLNKSLIIIINFKIRSKI